MLFLKQFVPSELLLYRGFNPCFPTSNPYILWNAIPIKYHEVSISTRTQSSFPMFNAYTPSSRRHIQKTLVRMIGSKLTWPG
jgi:hypothetical protein